MSDWVLKLAERLIVGHKRGGGCVYDEQAKQELILAFGDRASRWPSWPATAVTDRRIGAT